MNRVVKFAVLSSILLGSHAANATLPDGIYTGQGGVNDGMSFLQCNIQVIVDNNTVSVWFSPGYPDCSYVWMAANNPTGSGPSYTFNDVYLGTRYGACTGFAEIYWGGTYINFVGYLTHQMTGLNCQAWGGAQ